MPSPNSPPWRYPITSPAMTNTSISGPDYTASFLPLQCFMPSVFLPQDKMSAPKHLSFHLRPHPAIGGVGGINISDDIQQISLQIAFSCTQTLWADIIFGLWLGMDITINDVGAELCNEPLLCVMLARLLGSAITSTRTLAGGHSVHCHSTFQ